MIAGVNALVLDKSRIIVIEIHRLLGISVGTTHTIMHQHFNFQKLLKQWVPQQRTAEQRNTQMALSLSHLQRYHEKEYGFPSQIVTGDET
ncbi:histone-lysine N-methyltransferase SETMAR [Trichonephila clavata]|uniref:Histone-lysine N-methyltransferase SETMAR n=1 Tax=Trichonephila clavata TaxID=2740835 RepID=A0A8X6FW46_TRICU|nr:histone-lysine N-methyltransferase SETMAR [Trichonephila clavata]